MITICEKKFNFDILNFKQILTINLHLKRSYGVFIRYLIRGTSVFFLLYEGSLTEV